MKFVASITHEAQFSLSMINEEDTQLVFLDEWSGPPHFASFSIFLTQFI